jgi:hypothetical protein
MRAWGTFSRAMSQIKKGILILTRLRKQTGSRNSDDS